MSKLFDEQGKAVPVTIIEAGPCYVTQIKTKERDGYQALQLGFQTKREKLVTKPMAGHFKKAGSKPLSVLKEFRNFENYRHKIFNVNPETYIDIFDYKPIGVVNDILCNTSAEGIEGDSRKESDTV